MRALLAGGDGPLFVCGCKSNQGTFYDRFDLVVLLSAPADMLGYLETVEPLLRAGADVELDSGRLSVTELADALEALATA